jgi:hypothetical protein
MAACARRVRRRALRGLTEREVQQLKRMLGTVQANLEGKEKR